MKIYTKAGDKGTTSLFNGLRIKKSDKIVEALGSIDELNAMLGTLDLPLENIQKDLMVIAAQVAGYSARGGSALGRKSLKLEKEIDKMQRELPELRNFILPKGQIHLARAVARRCERTVIKAIKPIKAIKIIKYLNRLSDYLFVLARFVNYKNKIKETIWVTMN
ncbi:cob(I)yrinic acid a,c-diamide adenosyltransferase [Candidatus Gottesmanbacteria bacterium]|nr:cob(I)yrinic acid a,c-diamide adenosyltransferase [Candidatus Gottesmanbacteria bacterium]